MTSDRTTSPTMTEETPGGDDNVFLHVENLTVRFPTHDGLVQAVTDLSYTVERGKTLGIVGESGSGKSVSSMAILGLHDRKTARIEGSIRVGGVEVIGASEDKLRQIRGNDVAGCRRPQQGLRRLRSSPSSDPGLRTN